MVLIVKENKELILDFKEVFILILGIKGSNTDL